MSKAKFTPGPWVAQDRKSYIAIKTAEGQRIADISNLRIEQAANAALIAAAPDLLAALTEIAETGAKTSTIANVNALWRHQEIARAAIAKATTAAQVIET